MSENEKNSYRHPEGIYILEVIGNTLATKPNQTYVVLNCKVVAMKKGDSSKFVPNKLRSVNLWTTEATIDRTKKLLQAAQFPAGVSTARLRSDHPEHYSLAGFQFDASCRHTVSPSNGKTYDEFSALPVGGGNGTGKTGAWMDELPKPSTSDVMKLDELFGIAATPKPPAVTAAAGPKKARW